MEKYTECQKIHHNGKKDGCQEFMEEWSNPLICRICGCLQNFHLKVEPPVKYKTEVVYTKCHKVRDFKFQTSVDGCQEFAPKGKDDTADALICAVCGCHRGFHRNEITTEVTSSTY